MCRKIKPAIINVPHQLPGNTEKNGYSVWVWSVWLGPTGPGSGFSVMPNCTILFHSLVYKFMPWWNVGMEDPATTEKGTVQRTDGKDLGQV